MRAYITYARAVQRVARQIPRTCDRRWPAAAERGYPGFGGYVEFYAATWQGVCRRDDAALQKELTEANAGAAKAIADLADWLKVARGRLRQLRAWRRAIRADAEGQRGRDHAVAELEAASRADLKQGQQALSDASATYALGATVAACVAKMQGNKPERCRRRRARSSTC